MKKLSIEEKAAAYDKALENAKHYHSEMGDNICCVLEECFPILKESEDEKMRKSLLEYLHTLPNHYSHSGVCALEWIDWLESKVILNNIIEKVKTEKQRVLITETNGNVNIDWDTRSLEDARNLLKCGLQYINAELEKQGEQNPTDKIEPKFHEGDWVVIKQ